MVGRQIQRVEQVGLAIGAQLRQRNLRAGDDHRFSQVFQHEGECRRGERHGVGAVQDHEAVVAIVVLLDVVGDVLPVFRCHIRRVNQWRIFMNGEIRHFRAMEFGHQRQLALQVAGNRDIAVIGTLHADGAAGVGDVNGFLLHGHDFNKDKMG